MGFYEMCKSQEAKNKLATTENGATVFATSGNAICDFNFELTAMRKNASDEEIVEAFKKVFFEEKPETALRYLFFVRDCRGGIGERRIFKVCFNWLFEHDESLAEELVSAIPEYGRWSEVIDLLEKSENAKLLLGSQLIKDSASDNPSLLAKWMPSENSRSKKTKEMAEYIIKLLGFTPREYRKMLVDLRKKVDIVESKMSANKWSEIDYEKVPSKANLIYGNAFDRHDHERRAGFLDKVSTGEAKINASVLTPVDIGAKYFATSFWEFYVRDFDETVEALWKNLPSQELKNTLVVRDGSGSMLKAKIGDSLTPLSAATSLAVYCAEHNSGEWKDKFITFSEMPEVVDMSNCKNFHDKMEYCSSFCDCSNTDLVATMRLILNTAIANNIPVEEMPESILILSDMQFDEVFYGDDESQKITMETIFDVVAKEFEEAGYKLPKMAFWNLAGKVNKTIPMQQNQNGVVLCSGYSTANLDMILADKTSPRDAILEKIYSSRYDMIRDLINK